MFNEAMMRPVCLVLKMIMNAWCMCLIQSLVQDHCKLDELLNQKLTKKTMTIFTYNVHLFYQTYVSFKSRAIFSLLLLLLGYYDLLADAELLCDLLNV